MGDEDRAPGTARRPPCPIGNWPLAADTGLAGNTPGATECPTAPDGLVPLPPGDPVAHHHASAPARKYTRRNNTNRCTQRPNGPGLCQVHTNDTITQNILIWSLPRREHGLWAPPRTAGRRAVITGAACRWQRGEPGYGSPCGRQGHYSGNLFRWLPGRLPTASSRSEHGSDLVNWRAWQDSNPRPAA